MLRLNQNGCVKTVTKYFTHDQEIPIVLIVVQTMFGLNDTHTRAPLAEMIYSEQTTSTHVLH